MTQRTFIGIELAAPVRNALSGVRHSISKAEPDWAADKWVSDANLHVTLKFLGDLTSTRMADVCSVCDSVARPLHPFTMGVRGIAAIPRATSARMLWAEMGEGHVALTRLAEQLDHSLSLAGFPPDARTYRPHITLVRARAAKPIAGRALELAVESLHSASQDEAAMSVPHVTVYSSTLTRQGPVYRIHHRSTLGA